MATCEHTSCTCQAEDGKSFCSEWCAAHADAAECHCHHGGCEAPHSH